MSDKMTNTSINHNKINSRHNISIYIHTHMLLWSCQNLLKINDKKLF